MFAGTKFCVFGPIQKYQTLIPTKNSHLRVYIFSGKQTHFVRLSVLAKLEVPL